MALINVNDVQQEGEGWLFDLQIDGNSVTSHEVTLKKDYLEYLTGSDDNPEQLVVESLEYLLEREPNDSILATFDLSDINNYYPDFEDDMKKAWS